MERFNKYFLNSKKYFFTNHRIFMSQTISISQSWYHKPCHKQSPNSSNYLFKLFLFAIQIFLEAL